MRMSIIVLSCFFAGIAAQEASAAIKFKRFPSCPEGLVNKTCECHPIVSGRHHICHAGQYCIRHTFNGTCR
jgi:hypothetical protein